MKFKDLIKTLRTRQKMSKSDLAKAIKKTDAYIRKLEVEGYTPPTFAVCTIMADSLALEGEERLNFFRSAFLERIHADREYYNLLHSQKKTTEIETPQKKTQPLPKKHGEKNVNSNCVYSLSWTVSSKLKELPEQSLSMVEMILYGYLDKLDLKCHSLSATKKKVSVVLEIPPTYVINDLVESFKQHTAGLIRSQYPTRFKNPEIWDDKTSVTTTEPAKEVATTKKATSSNVNDSKATTKKSGVKTIPTKKKAVVTTARKK